MASSLKLTGSVANALRALVAARTSMGGCSDFTIESCRYGWAHGPMMVASSLRAVVAGRAACATYCC